MSSESDLLRVVLALQMGFVTKEQIVEAGAVWAQKRKSSLLDILEEKGFLKPKARKALDGLAEAKVEENGGDADKSLSALFVDDDVRSSLLSLPIDDQIKGTLLEHPGFSDRQAARFQAPETVLLPLPEKQQERYQLGAEIGRGGLGRVVAARDSVLGREVAVKEMLKSTEARLVRRFLREGEIAGRLSHPNVVPVLDIGIRKDTDAGTPYFVMIKIAGRDLREIIKDLEAGVEAVRKEFSRPRLLQCFQDVCIAMAYAHDHGVIHRDLKPANVMAGNYGEVYVVDWGLAKIKGQTEDVSESREDPPGLDRDATRRRKRNVDQAVVLTMDGEIMGTPAYMPPEQAGGRISEIDERSDIYSLGAILYELLTFRPPFEGATGLNVIAKVLTSEVTAPSARVTAIRKESETRKSAPPPGDTIFPEQDSLSPEPQRVSPDPVPPELDQIVLKAMAREKKDRYATAREIYDDVRNFLEGEKERERNRERALAKVAEGKALVEKLALLRAEATSAKAESEEKSREIRTFWPVERKAAYWAVEDREKNARRQVVETFTEAGAAFQEALGFERDNPEARSALADLYWDQYLRAEDVDDESEMIRWEKMVRQFNDGQYDATLKGDGSLTLRTWRYPCACLDPVKDTAWHVSIAGDEMIPSPFGSKEFREDSKRFVPGVKVEPAGSRFGHGPDCRPQPVHNASIAVFRFEEEGRRLVLKAPIWEGKSPLKSVPLPMGSYLAEISKTGFKDVRCPIRIGRQEKVEQDVTLYTCDEVPAGTAIVPRGRFISGGSKAGGLDKRVPLDVPYDYFVSVNPVTCAEYLEFLNDLSVTDPEQAWKRSPRAAPEGEQDWPFVPEPAPAFPDQAQTKKGLRKKRRLAVEKTAHAFGPGRFAIPTAQWLSSAPEDLKKAARRLQNTSVDWEESWPVFGISWYDALAYCEWRSRREGRVITLLTDEEWEKAARGADGRVYPFGDNFDPTWGNVEGTFEDGLRPCGVNEFPQDESPYGIRGLAGNARDWCLCDVGGRYRKWRCMRGGAWLLSANMAKTGMLWGDVPDNVYWRDGFRVGFRALSYEST